MEANVKGGKILHSRTIRYGSHSVLQTVIFIAILVFAVLITENNPWRLDLTESKEFTLSQQSQNILKSVAVPIQIKAFFQEPSREKTKAKDLLESYKYYCPKLKYQFIDPDRHPGIAKQYDIRSYGTFIIEGAGKKESVTHLSEENLTNGIMKIIQHKKKIIYFLTGHGEANVNDYNKAGYSMVRRELEKENYDVKTLDLLHQATVPSDASVVMVVGPRKSLLKEERVTLRKYINEGGKLCVMLDPYFDGGLEKFLRDYGIKIKRDIVIDKLSRVFGGSYLMPVVTKYAVHDITKNFNVATFFPECRSIKRTKNHPKNVDVIPLALTSSGAWAETDLKTLKEKNMASFNPNQDQPGPVSLVALAEIKPLPKKDAKKKKKGNEKESIVRKKGQLVVFGDSDFANNTYFGLSGNGDFLLNVVNYLAQRENLISIERPTRKGRPLILSRSQSRLLLLIPLVIIPLFVLVCGIVVYQVRRKHR